MLVSTAGGCHLSVQQSRPIDCIKMGDAASVIEALNVEIQGGMA